MAKNGWYNYNCYQFLIIKHSKHAQHCLVGVLEALTPLHDTPSYLVRADLLHYVAGHAEITRPNAVTAFSR